MSAVKYSIQRISATRVTVGVCSLECCSPDSESTQALGGFTPALEGRARTEV
jgi:hypothetical protein